MILFLACLLTVLTETDEHEINNSTYEYNCGYELTLRLLDQDKKVVLKDATSEQVFSLL